MKLRLSILMFLLWLAVAQTGWSFYNPQPGRWFSRDPLVQPGFKPTEGPIRSADPRIELHSAVFVVNNPVSYWDILGLDQPGCTIPLFGSPTPGSPLNDCLLRCCAQHDFCFFNRNGRNPTGDPLRRCHSTSWFQVWNPCSPCGACDRRVVGCWASCLVGSGPQEGHLFFCPNGPFGGLFFDTLAEIPASCYDENNP